MIWLQNTVKSGTALVDDFHANSPVKINLHILIIFHVATKAFDQRELEYILVNDGWHNLLKLGEGTSRKAIFASSRDIMQVNIDRGHVGHLHDVECPKKKSVCVLSDPEVGDFEGISMRGVNYVRALSEVDYQLLLWNPTPIAPIFVSHGSQIITIANFCETTRLKTVCAADVGVGVMFM
jgi:hypothetical protein